MDEQRHTQFQHFCNIQFYKQYKIINKTSNLSYIMYLRINKFTQLQSNDYNDNTNIPPTIKTSTSETTQSHAPPITTTLRFDIRSNGAVERLDLVSNGMSLQ